MPVAPTNEMRVVATSAMPVEEINDTPAVATSAMPVEQANEAPVAPNNEMSMTVPPHLLGVVPSTTNLMVQINNYGDLPLKALVKFNGNEIEIVQGNEACLPQGPPFFKWAIENLIPELKALVRGILRRTNLVANKSR